MDESGQSLRVSVERAQENIDRRDHRSVSDAVALARVPLLDFRRQQVQLDTAAKRAAILQLRLGDPEVIVVFE